MKRGTSSAMPITIGLDLDTVERIEFIFVQDRKKLNFTYPSDKAVRDGNQIVLLWSQADTMYFDADTVSMDTHVHLFGAQTNPETKIVSFKMKPTLFDRGILPDDKR